MSRLEVSKGGVHTSFISNHGLRSTSLTYNELDVATESFAQKHFLGKGGFGEVYKGVLDGNHVSSCVSGQFNSRSYVQLCICVLNLELIMLLVCWSRLHAMVIF